MKKQVFWERECIHRDDGVDGDLYNGASYVQALQRLQVDAAMELASKVSPFFWADAPNIMVWLCHLCAAELRLSDTPSVMAHSARKQA